MTRENDTSIKYTSKLTSYNNEAISVIVPTLNEAQNLPLLFRRINDSLVKHNIAYEIIVIDDNSADNTLLIAQKYKDKFHVRAITKKGKPGKAYSLIEGFALAHNGIICMIDADLQYPPEEIPVMYKKMHNLGVDIVITERNDLQTSFIRKLSSKIFNIIFARLLFGINYDTQSGLKLLNKSVINTIEISPSPWSFDLEFIIRSIEAGFKIASHQITFSKRYKGQPKISMLRASIELSVASIKLRRATSLKTFKERYEINNEYIKSAVTLFVLCAVASLSLNSLNVTKASALAPNPNSSHIVSLAVIEPANTVLNDLNNSFISSGTGTATTSQANDSSTKTTSPSSNITSSTTKTTASRTPSQGSATQTKTIAATPTASYSEKHTNTSDPVYTANKLNTSSTKHLDKIVAILFIAALLMFGLGFTLTKDKKKPTTKNKSGTYSNKRYSTYVSKSR
jgi:glycosyltransferase involved in cell wall biosynthesis